MRSRNIPLVITTKEQAIETGLRFYFPGTPCRNGHIARRSLSKRKAPNTRAGWYWATKCEECRKAARKKSRSLNKMTDRLSSIRSGINQGIHCRVENRRRYRPSTYADRMLGIRTEDYLIWLAKKFRDGMSWSNWGVLWEIDHIRPCHTFTFKGEQDYLDCFHYTNTRPLFKKENEWQG